MKKILYTLATFFLTCSLAYGATGFKEDFNGTLNAGWQPNGNYSISQSDGTMKIEVEKYQGFQAFSFDLGAEYDFSANPFANLKIRASKGTYFALYFANADGKKLGKETRVIGTGDSELFNNYFFDFSGSGTALLDRTKVRSIIINVAEKSLSTNNTLWIDDLCLGDGTVKLADIGAIPDHKYYAGTAGIKIQLTDIKNAASVQVSGGSGVVSNAAVSAISNGLATLSFDVKNVTANENITVTAKGASGYVDKAVIFNLAVEQNLPPTIDATEEIDVPVNVPYTVTLTGISDGNSTVDQVVTIIPGSLNAYNPAPEVLIKYNNGDSKATLTFTAPTAATYKVPIQLTDNGTGNNAKNVELTINAYNNFNNPPDFTIYDTEVYSTESSVSIDLIDLNDGDGIGDEGVNFSSIVGVSSNESVADQIEVKSVLGQPTRRYLTARVMGVGTTEISVTATDAGGNGSNNGNQSVTKKIKLEVLAPPLTGHTIDFSKFTEERDAGMYTFEGEDKLTTLPSIVDDAGGKYMLLDYQVKSTWDGWWYRNPELDLTANPYMSYELYPENDNIETHTYLYDNMGARNDNGANAQRKICPKGTWTKVFLDYRDPKNQTEGSGEELINLKRIDTLLFNIHRSFGWPFTEYTGKVRVRNIRIGSDVVNTDIPTLSPKTTIDAVSNQYFYAGSGGQIIILTGITDGLNGSKTPTLSVSATAGAANISELTTVPNVNAEGKAIIMFTVSSAAEKSTTIQIKVSAEGSQDNTITFNVVTLGNTTADAVDITLDPSVKGFPIAGLGANPSAHDIDLFAKEWGGSTVRLFPVGDDIEPVNDNNDPNSLDRSKISREGLRVEYIKQLMAAGVEHVFMTVLSPPSWMKQNLSNDYYTDAYFSNSDQSDNKVPDYYFDEYVEFLVACVEVIKEETGLELAGICAQNEPEFCEPYGSAILDAQRELRLYTMTEKRFKELGIKTKLIYCETPWGWCQNWASNLKSNGAALTQTVFGIHYPNTNNGQWASMFSAAGREIWGAECSAAGNNWTNVQGEVNKVLIGFNNGLTHWAVFGFSGSDAMVQGNTPTRNFYGFKNLTRYIRPGDVQIKSTCSSSDINVAAFECENERRLTFVMSNNAATEKKVILPMQVKSKYTIYRSSSNEKCIEVPNAIAVAERVLVLPPKSVTTIVAIDNSPLFMNQPADMQIECNAPEQTVALTGIERRLPTTDLYTLSVTATSSNTALIPNPTVQYTSPQSTATLKFTPVANQEGTATITVTLSGSSGADAYDPNSYTFDVTVSRVGVDIAEQAPALYPNPATDVINYDAPFIGEGWRYSIVSATGATMKSSNIAAGNSLQINISDLAPGWYLLHVTNGIEVKNQPFQKR